MSEYKESFPENVQEREMNFSKMLEQRKVFHENLQEREMNSSRTLSSLKNHGSQLHKIKMVGYFLRVLDNEGLIQHQSDQKFSAEKTNQEEQIGA